MSQLKSPLVEFISAVQEAQQTGLALYECLELSRINDNHQLQGFYGNELCNLPFVLVSKYVEPLGNSGSTPQMNSTMNEGNDSLASFEGSPLRLQEFFISNDADYVDAHDKKSIQPTTVIRARQLLSSYIMGKRENLLPLWVMCDGTDKQRTVYMGCGLHSDRADVLDQYKVTTEGPCVKTKMPELEKLVKRDLKKSNCKVSMDCYAKYDILTRNTSQDNTLMGDRGSLELELKWSKASSLLQHPPLDAVTIMNATVTAGDMSSAVYLMYSELHILKNFARGLEDGQVTWAVQDDGGEEVPLQEKTKDLIEKLQRGECGSTECLDEDADTDDEVFSVHKLNASGRGDLDFTEQLWNVLKSCSSYHDLTECLQIVIRCLQNADFQPMVHKGNTSTLAGYVRASYVGELHFVNLNGLVPLQLVCEIGVEKLRRDYIYVMIGKDLVTASHIECLIQNSKEVAVLERVTRLEKLHLCLELVVMLAQYLSLPKVVLGISARNAIRHFEKNVVDKHVFTMPLQTKYISHIIEKRHPSIWKIVLDNKIGSEHEHGIYYLSALPPFPHQLNSDSSGNLSVEDEDNAKKMYYLTRGIHQVICL